MRTKIVAGNWKMNNNVRESKKLIKKLKKSIRKEKLKNIRIIVAPPFVNLQSCVKYTKKSKIEISAQNMHQANKGAYTGEISAEMLKSIDVKTIILGHSERRAYYNETDEILAIKVNTIIEKGLETIFCIGESLEDRKANIHFSVVENQLKSSLFHIKANNWKNIILAYEPVWAIGTGETASPNQVQIMHEHIRSVIEKKYSNKVAEKVSILYGGSVNQANAKSIFSNPDVDGGLIGSASLSADSFTDIIKSF